MDLISVIVPVYKVEAYLDRCVQSIVDQTYQNLEIILVDDGSPDNCGCICDAWAERDSRIKVIHKENGGGAQARNAGMDFARGQYLGFVDSDDYIHPQMYGHLMDILKKTDSDMAECGYIITENGKIPNDTPIENSCRILNTEEALRENIRNGVCQQVVWNKLYKREVIGSIRMIEGKTIDDEFFTYRVLAKAKKIAVSQRKLYAYFQQPNSVMHQGYSLKRLEAVEAKSIRLSFLQERFPSLVPEASTNLCFTCMYHGQLALRMLKDEELTEAFYFLRKTVKNCRERKTTMPLTHRIWIMLAKTNLMLCCRIRNILGIGL